MSSFDAPCQAGSTPKGYGPRPPSFLVSYMGLYSTAESPSLPAAHRDSKSVKPSEKKSLYRKPAYI